MVFISTQILDGCVCTLVGLLFLKYIVHFHSHFYLDYLMLIIPTCITKLMKVKNYDAPCSILRMISTLGVQQLTEKIKTTHQLPYQHHHVSCFYSVYILSILDEKLVLSSSVNINQTEIKQVIDIYIVKLTVYFTQEKEYRSFVQQNVKILGSQCSLTSYLNIFVQSNISIIEASFVDTILILLSMMNSFIKRWLCCSL